MFFWGSLFWYVVFLGLFVVCMLCCWEMYCLELGKGCVGRYFFCACCGEVFWGSGCVIWVNYLGLLWLFVFGFCVGIVFVSDMLQFFF